VGGSSVLQWSQSGTTRQRRKGATGEYLIDTCLHRDLHDGEIILNDRRLPGGCGNVDHVVVAPSGVWIIDTKHRKGRIEYKGQKGIFDADERLFIDGRDCTHLTDDLYAQVIPVASLIGDRSIPIHPALVFVNGDWSSVVRLLMGKPYSHNGVYIAWPKALVSKIKGDGQLSPREVARIGSLLDSQLVAM
jgi:hypothetical protein